MRTLITGATGFIGRHLVRKLSSAGHEVVCLVRPTSNRAGLESLPGVSFALGDMLERPSLEAPVGEVDAVFHLAALLRVPWRKDFLTVNADGADNVAAACAAATRPPVLVVVSSLAAAGAVPEGSDPRRESDLPGPVSRYGEAKLAAEAAAAAYADRVPVSIVRPPIVFGPEDRAAFRLFRMAARGRFLTPTRRAQHMSLVDVDYLTEVLIEVAERGERLPPPAQQSNDVGRGVYYAAADESLELGDLGRVLGEALGGSQPRVVRVPCSVTHAVGVVGELLARTTRSPARFTRDKAREATAGSWMCSSAKVREQLGVSHSPLSTALAATAGWYQENGWL